MLTPLALALHELLQLLAIAREKLLRATRLGKPLRLLAGRVTAFEEAVDILDTAVTTQREADAARAAASHPGYTELDLEARVDLDPAPLPPERVVVPYEGKGGLRSLRDADDEAASTLRLGP